jgi:hypothetical protein
MALGPYLLAAVHDRRGEGHVPDHALDARDAPHPLRQRGVQRYALGQDRLLAVVLVARVELVRPVPGHHQRRAREPLRRNVVADAGLQQPAAGQHDRSAEEQRDESGQEAALPEPQRT